MMKILFDKCTPPKYLEKSNTTMILFFMAAYLKIQFRKSRSLCNKDFLKFKLISKSAPVNQITLNQTAVQILTLSIFEILVLISLDVNLSWNQTFMIFLLYVRYMWKTN